MRAATRVLLAAVLCAPFSLRAADSDNWYVVKEHETLQQIAERELGNVARWEELWHLNELPDPHKLTPGQRLRMPPRAIAQVELAARRVDEQNFPAEDWTPTEVGRRLKERDGVRTYEQSSAEVGFDDGSRLVLTEQSLAFIRRPQASAPASAGQRRAIEVVAGHADVETPKSAAPAGIDIFIGSSKTTARPGEADARARGRRTPAGTSQVMVFSGTAEVESAGRKVEVAEGEGTSVADQRPPGAPEKLLPAPEALKPAKGEHFGVTNPQFRWYPVPGGASYVLEVCRDPACGDLVQRVTGIKACSWEPSREKGLPLGPLMDAQGRARDAFFWRITAISASGLDGFPSAPVPFFVRGNARGINPSPRPCRIN